MSNAGTTNVLLGVSASSWEREEIRINIGIEVVVAVKTQDRSGSRVRGDDRGKTAAIANDGEVSLNLVFVVDIVEHFQNSAGSNGDGGFEGGILKIGGGEEISVQVAGSARSVIVVVKIDNILSVVSRLKKGSCVHEV
eukprot:TRINITY_DN16441_c0_g1_i1.p1 TRINITY_DN16441_c0_g1~~TRINITY_DN16441_c0_g1_i1.p1  ORF type:complete len:138 (+),score=17.64 TRINITY_DN16441_c0_g1_i1:159-572(+)